MGLTLEQERAAWYLAGVFDSEGCVSFRDTPSGVKKQVTIVNTDESIISSTCIALDLLEIGYKLRGPVQKKTFKPYWEIRINAYDDIITFVKFVPLQSVKAEKLRFLAKAAETRGWHQVSHWSIEEIARLYWDEGVSPKEIASRLGMRSAGQVRYVMQQNSIALRTQADGAAMQLSRRWSQSV